MSCLDAALAYAKRGWPVLPVDGKVPLTSNGVKNATTDPEQIERLWTHWGHPETTDVAIRTGISPALSCSMWTATTAPNRFAA